MYKIYRTSAGIVLEKEQSFLLLEINDWDQLINQAALFNFLKATKGKPVDLDQLQILAPIGQQEIWAAGVTYLRSKAARMEESKTAGGDDFYDKVYDADRPELFFKSTANRVAGPGDVVHIRRDSKWNVPEPELTLFINRQQKISAYTIGNDMSSRDIEGENPLYLPQAKTYDRSAALGPCLLVMEQAIDPLTNITLKVTRQQEVIFDDSLTIQQMKRTQEELVDYLFRECSFPNGCFLMTGTGIVPPDHFTLEVGDVIQITITGIGTLTNTVTTK